MAKINIICIVVFLILWLLVVIFTVPFERSVTPDGESQIHNSSNVQALTHQYTTSVQRFYNKRTESPNYIIYRCEGQTQCGGWSDRLSGMLMCFAISELLGYNFGIVMTKPCDVNEFFSHNTINWTLDTNRLSALKSSNSHLINSERFGKSLPAMNLKEEFSSDVNYITMNWDYTVQMMRRPDAHQRLPWMYSTHVADIYRRFYHSIFKPKQNFIDSLNAFKSKLDRKRRTVCAHVRTCSEEKTTEWRTKHYFPVSKIGILWEFLKQFNDSASYIYIATDTNKMKSEGKAHFPENFIDIPGPITHSDKSESCLGYEKSLLEFQWLLECDTVVFTPSGFGITAGYARKNSNNMYCLTRNGVVPCSRYTLEKVLDDQHIRAILP